MTYVHDTTTRQSDVDNRTRTKGRSPKRKMNNTEPVNLNPRKNPTIFAYQLQNERSARILQLCTRQYMFEKYIKKTNFVSMPSTGNDSELCIIGKRRELHLITRMTGTPSHYKNVPVRNYKVLKTKNM